MGYLATDSECYNTKQNKAEDVCLAAADSKAQHPPKTACRKVQVPRNLLTL